ncbi:UNVERIFIED_CONTAM: mlec-a [Trichonephila clavipes]
MLVESLDNFSSKIPKPYGPFIKKQVISKDDPYSSDSQMVQHAGVGITSIAIDRWTTETFWGDSLKILTFNCREQKTVWFFRKFLSEPMNDSNAEIDNETPIKTFLIEFPKVKCKEFVFCLDPDIMNNPKLMNKMPSHYEFIKSGFNCINVPQLPSLASDEKDEEEEEATQEKKASPIRYPSGPRIPNPYETEDSSTMLPIFIAIGAFLPLLFCLCRL